MKNGKCPEEDNVTVEIWKTQDRENPTDSSTRWWNTEFLV